jgi:hypothetical protein
MLYSFGTAKPGIAKKRMYKNIFSSETKKTADEAVCHSVNKDKAG